jgi:hypothetical protein
MSIDSKFYFKVRDDVINFYQLKKDLDRFSETDLKSSFSKSNLRNLIIIFHDFSIIVQYYENGILNIVNIDIENKKLSRNSTLFSKAELRLFDNYGFELHNSYEQEFGISIDDWFKRP